MRISSIEGMRAVFAFWVVVHHTLANAGFDKSGNILWSYLRSASYAVDLFIIISGFVIFYLIDNKKENYGEYIIRRFFRLFPVFALLFMLAIPLSLFIPENAVAYSHLFVDNNFPRMEYFEQWWTDLELNIVTHLTMLHGLVPEVVSSGAPTAFLGPAWSISLEWQFYLFAPLIFGIAINIYNQKYDAISSIFIMLAFTGLMAVLLYTYPLVLRGAFFPAHYIYFLIGWVSYFVFKSLSLHEVHPDSVFLVTVSLAIIIALLSKAYLSNSPLIVLCIWLTLFPLLLSNPQPSSAARISTLFRNRPMMFLGRISYSIYLSHPLVIIITMKLLSPYAASFNSLELLAILLPTVLIATVLVSYLLYKFVESPGMRIGKVLSQRYNRKIMKTAESGS